MPAVSSGLSLTYSVTQFARHPSVRFSFHRSWCNSQSGWVLETQGLILYYFSPLKMSLGSNKLKKKKNKNKIQANFTLGYNLGKHCKIAMLAFRVAIPLYF